ncbi:hypothetical protein Droror1_Dr00009005 [Drosera rotundifolia]
MASRGPLLNSTFVILIFVALVLMTHAPLHQVDAYDLDSNFTTCSVFKPIFHYVCGSYLRDEADTVPKCCCDLIKIVQSSIPDAESCFGHCLELIRSPHHRCIMLGRVTISGSY